MNIAFCVQTGDENPRLDMRFGRTQFFWIINVDTTEYKVIENSAKNASGGAGSQAVQQLIDNDVDVVIAPELGPQAFDALDKFKIPAFKQGTCSSVDEALSAWKQNVLEKLEKPGNKGLHRV